MTKETTVKVLIGALALTFLLGGYHVFVQMPVMLKKAKESVG